VAHALRADGFDASEDGTGRGTPLVPVAFSAMPMNSGKDFVVRQTDVAQPIMAAGPSLGNQGGDYIAQPVSVAVNSGLEARTVPQAVAFDCKAGANTGFAIGDVPGALRGEGHGGGHAAVAFDMRGREGGAQFEGPHETANIRAANGGSSRRYVAERWAVRRLTPREWERLQGFPDDFTAIPGAKDGPRYKALGNSMAINVMRYIGERILAAQA
jgi:DNA (cytosine-5)-methyltransferase 1